MTAQPLRYPGGVDDVLEGRRITLARLLHPARTRQRDALLARYRWANAGLRERLRVEVTEHDRVLDTIEALADEWARTIGHAHPLIVGLRAIVAEGRLR